MDSDSSHQALTKLPGTKKLFWKLGTCSQTLAHIMNRELGNRDEKSEKALDPLAGGIIREGHQCGMLWGAALGVGAEAFKKCQNPDQAKRLAISVTRDLVDSFEKRTSSSNCRNITKTNFNSGWGMAKYMLGGGPIKCFNLADKWAPEAVSVALERFNDEQLNTESPCENCASLMIRKMGGTEEEQVLVAGFAGGLGLSGNGCGALAAAIWKDTKDYCENYPDKSAYANKGGDALLEAFKASTQGELSCQKITSVRFESVEAHSEYINSGACKEHINALVDCFNRKNEL